MWWDDGHETVDLPNGATPVRASCAACWFGAWRQMILTVRC